MTPTAAERTPLSVMICEGDAKPLDSAALAMLVKWFRPA
jgi:hypothetical protein